MNDFERTFLNSCLTGKDLESPDKNGKSYIKLISIYWVYHYFYEVYPN